MEDWTSGSDNKPVQVKGHGTLEITFVNKHGQPVDLDIHCFYATNCTANLLSIGQIYNQTNDVTVAGPGRGRSDYFDGSGLHFLSTQQVQLAPGNNMCFVIGWHFTNSNASKYYHTGKLRGVDYIPPTVKMTARDAHLTFYHSDKVVDQLEKEGRIEIIDRDNSTMQICEACCSAKLQNASYKRISDSWSVVNAKAGEVLVSDNVGPYNVPISFKGDKYLNLIKDKHSGIMHATAVLMSLKSFSKRLLGRNNNLTLR